MSFLVWRVLKGKIPTNDVLKRFGYSIVFGCSCCAIDRGVESINHIFSTCATIKKVWQHIAGPLGILLSSWCIRATLTNWGKVKGMTRLQRYILKRIPVIVMWELWVHHTQCKYCEESPSIARIMFQICKDVNECLHRKWKGWDLNVRSWNVLVDKMFSLKDRRVVAIKKWSRPLEGYFKINVVYEDRATDVVVRDWRGSFCFAAMKVDVNISLHDGINMVNERLSWCKVRNKVCIQIEVEESELWNYVKDNSKLQGRGLDEFESMR